MNVNPCVCCDEEAPEGSQICWSCEHGYTNQVGYTEKNKYKLIDKIKEWFRCRLN